MKMHGFGILPPLPLAFPSERENGVFQNIQEEALFSPPGGDVRRTEG